MATAVVSVTLFKKYDEAVITVDASALTGKKGYIKVTIDTLAHTVKDVPSDGLPYNYSPDVVVPTPDQVPNFTVLNDALPGGYGGYNKIIDHPMSKIAGTKTYKGICFIFAVNDGKLDANANTRVSNNGVTGTTFHVLLRAIIQKLDEWPCDDDVIATLTFTKTESLNAI